MPQAERRGYSAPLREAPIGSRMPERFRIEIAPTQSVTAVEYPAAVPNRAGITLILGHGAGAGQGSDFIVTFAAALAALGIDVFTFNFFYSEHGRRVPDPNARLEACFRAVIENVRCRNPTKLAIGGKAMRPPGRPDRLRAAHLRAVRAPMLFVQGSRDAFGTPAELQSVIATLESRGELYVVEGGDHSFKVPRSAGVRQQDVYHAIQARIETWLRAAGAN